MKTLVWILLILFGVFAEPYLSDPLSDMSHETCGFACYATHIGTDYQQYEGAPVYAAHDGYLTAHLMTVGNKGGNYIVLDDKNGGKSRYLHLKSFGPGIEAEKEILVARGQIIGYMGNTGGPWKQGEDENNNPIMRSPVHLHFEAYLNGKAVDPYSEETFLWLKGLPIVFSCRTDFDFVSATQQFDPQGFRYSTISSATFATMVSSEKGSLQVKVLGANPGVESPAFVFCPLASRTKVRFAAKVYGKTISQVENESMVWVRDQRGKWDNSARPVRLSNNSKITGDGDYEEWQVDFSQLVISNLDNEVRDGRLKAKQFSLELTETGTSAYWTIDWVKVECGLFAAETFEGWKMSGGSDLGREFLRWKIDPSADPQIITPLLDGFDVGIGVQVQILFVFGTKGGSKLFDLGQVYWKNSSSESYSGQKRAVFLNIADGTKTVACDGQTHLAVAEIGQAGKLAELRLDPINDGEAGAQDSIIFRSVSIVRQGDPGWVSTSSGAVTVIQQGVFLASSYERQLSFPIDTDKVTPPSSYPFQFGFTPVDYGNFTFNGLVFGLRKEADGGCWNVLDTGNVFLPNGANIFCVMELADISGSFQDNMVFYKDNVVWWETGYGPISNTNGSVWSCAAMPIEANCFKQPGQYQVEAKIKHNGKEYSLAKRNLIVSSGNSILSPKELTRNKVGPGVSAQVFNLGGRLISANQVRGRGVFLVHLEKSTLKKDIFVH